MKIKTFSIAAFFLFSLFYPSLIPSTSASTVSNNEANVNSLNLINGEDSTSVSNEEVETSPLMMFGGKHGVEEHKKAADRDDVRRRADERGEDEDHTSSQMPRGTAGTAVIAEREAEIDDSLPFSMEESMAIEKQFKDAIIAYPDAPRLIVLEGEIVPPDPNITSNNKDPENHEIMRLLKNVITVCYSPNIANSIPELSPMAFVSAKDLSASKISEIFGRLDNADNEHSTANHFDLVPRLRGGMMGGGAAAPLPAIPALPNNFDVHTLPPFINACNGLAIPAGNPLLQKRNKIVEEANNLLNWLQPPYLLVVRNDLLEDIIRYRSNAFEATRVGNANLCNLWDEAADTASDIFNRDWGRAANQAAHFIHGGNPNNITNAAMWNRCDTLFITYVRGMANNVNTPLLNTLWHNALAATDTALHNPATGLWHKMSNARLQAAKNAGQAVLNAGWVAAGGAGNIPVL